MGVRNWVDDQGVEHCEVTAEVAEVGAAATQVGGTEETGFADELIDVNEWEAGTDGMD